MMAADPEGAAARAMLASAVSCLNCVRPGRGRYRGGAEGQAEPRSSRKTRGF